MTTITLAQLAKFQIHARFASCLMDVVDELRSSQNLQKFNVKSLIGKSNLSHARSMMVTEWYDDPSVKDEDGFFFLDADHTFTSHDILRVISQTGDLNAGIYCNRAREPTSYSEEGWSDKADNIPLLYAGTGFLFFRKSAVRTIHNQMKQTEGLDRVVISDTPEHVEGHTIPFFHSIIIPDTNNHQKRFWLGEDFSFSWRARAAGLTIRGCISSTLGHEIPYVVYTDKPRRPPQKWHPSAIAIQCGPRPISLEEINTLCQGFRKHGLGCIVQCGNFSSQNFDDAIMVRRCEEFTHQDAFDRIVFVGQESLLMVANVQNARERILQLDKKLDRIPAEFERMNAWVFSSEEIRNHQAPRTRPEKTFVGDVSTFL